MRKSASSAQLNIGLENNPIEFGALFIRTIDRALERQDLFAHIETRSHVALWQGKPERTIVVRLKFNRNADVADLEAISSYLCREFDQDYIPFVLGNSTLANSYPMRDALAVADGGQWRSDRFEPCERDIAGLVPHPDKAVQYVEFDLNYFVQY